MWRIVSISCSCLRSPLDWLCPYVPLHYVVAWARAHGVRSCQDLDIVWFSLPDWCVALSEFGQALIPVGWTNSCTTERIYTLARFQKRIRNLVTCCTFTFISIIARKVSMRIELWRKAVVISQHILALSCGTSSRPQETERDSIRRNHGSCVTKKDCSIY